VVARLLDRGHCFLGHVGSVTADKNLAWEAALRGGDSGRTVARVRRGRPEGADPAWRAIFAAEG
jgi:hypothetical protein